MLIQSKTMVILEKVIFVLSKFLIHVAGEFSMFTELELKVNWVRYTRPIKLAIYKANIDSNSIVPIVVVRMFIY